MVNIEFLGLQLDPPTWKNHIERMLHGPCNAARSMVHISDITTLKSLHFAYLYSVTDYGIIF